VPLDICVVQQVLAFDTFPQNLEATVPQLTSVKLALIANSINLQISSLPFFSMPLESAKFFPLKLLLAIPI
jgi:hypothetical protein